MIIRYFIRGSYRMMNDYGFTEGLLLVILGVLGLVRAQQLAGVFFVIAGLLLLLCCIVKLQYALDLRSIGARIWSVVLVITLLLTAAAIVGILNPFSSEDTYQKFTYILLLVDGIFGIILIVFMLIRFSVWRRRERRDREAPPHERDGDFPPPPPPRSVDTDEIEEDRPDE